jgi:hypothetical protein
VIEASDLPAWVGRGVWQYFVASSTLSPWLGDHLEDCDLSDLAVTGFINVQVGRPNGGGKFGPATASVVSDVSDGAGTRRRHEEYIHVFRSLVAAANGAASELGSPEVQAIRIYRDRAVAIRRCGPAEQAEHRDALITFASLPGFGRAGQ